MRTSRRALMRLLAAAAGMALDRRLARAATPLSAGAGASLAACLGSADSAAAVGAAYLRDRPAERDPALLTAVIRAGIARSDPTLAGLPVEAIPAVALRSALRQAATADLAAGDVVIVDGWVLSRTEARLCALACCG